MSFEKKLDNRFVVGTFKKRTNRFVMEVWRNDGRIIRAYCPNTSRLIGLLGNQPEVLLTQNTDSTRKTDYTVRGIRQNGHWVGIEASRANEIFERYLKQSSAGVFNDWSHLEREHSYESSQLDFYRVDGDRPEWVEVKSLSSRSSNGDAFYSGTPSPRGYRHLNDLGELSREGNLAHCVFVIQRHDVTALSPGKVTHSDWLKALRSAREEGVNVHAFRCTFDGSTWNIEREIPARL